MPKNSVSIGNVTNCVFSIGDGSEVTVGGKTYVNGQLVSESEVTIISSEDDED